MRVQVLAGISPPATDLLGQMLIPSPLGGDPQSGFVLVVDLTVAHDVVQDAGREKWRPSVKSLGIFWRYH